MYPAPVLELSAKGYSGTWGLQYYDDSGVNTEAIRHPCNAGKRYKEARFLIGKIFTIIPQTTIAIRLI